MRVQLRVGAVDALKRAREGIKGTTPGRSG